MSPDAKNNSKTYFYRGFHIVVTVDQGVSVVEQYWKELRLTMSTMELASLFAANSGGARWPMPEQNGYDFYYKTQTGLVFTAGSFTDLWLPRQLVPTELSRAARRTTRKRLTGFKVMTGI